MSVLIAPSGEHEGVHAVEQMMDSVASSDAPTGYGKYHYYVPNGLMNEDGSCAYSFTSNGHFNDHLVVFHFTVEHASGLTYEETPEIEALYRGKLVGFGILRDNPEAAVDRGLLDKLGIQWSHVARGRQRPTSNHASKRQSVHRSATMFKVVVDVHSKTKANELFTARFASGNPTNTNAHLISKLLGLKKGDVHGYLSRCPLAAKEREAYCCAIGTDSDGTIVGAVCFRHVERPRRASASQYGFTELLLLAVDTNEEAAGGSGAVRGSQVHRGGSDHLLCSPPSSYLLLPRAARGPRPIVRRSLGADRCTSWLHAGFLSPR